MDIKKYYTNEIKSSFQLIISLIVIILIAFSALKMSKEIKSTKLQNIKACEDYKKKEKKGIVTRIEYNHGWDYVFTNNYIFVAFCGDVSIEIGDSIFKPAGTLDYYIFKFNPDTVFFIKCNFNCDSSYKEKPSLP